MQLTDDEIRTLLELQSLRDAGFVKDGKRVGLKGVDQEAVGIDEAKNYSAKMARPYYVQPCKCVYVIGKFIALAKRASLLWRSMSWYGENCRL